MPTNPFHDTIEGIELVELQENVVGSVVNRPLQRIWENSLHNAEVWAEWLADPVLENNLQINASLSMTGDLGVDGDSIFGGYGDFAGYIEATGHIRSEDYIQGDKTLTIMGHSNLKGGAKIEDYQEVITAGENLAFTVGNSGAGGIYGSFLDTSANGDAGGLLVRTGDTDNDEMGFSLYNHLNNPVFEVSATQGDVTLGPEGQLYKIDSDNVVHEIIDNNAKISRAVFNDLAEFMPKNGDVEPGDVLIWKDGGVKACESASDKRVMGVYSDTYGIYIGGKEQSEEDNLKEFAPQGLCGRVKVKAVGPIKIMDQLESSDIKGHARKSTEEKTGTIIGKALEELADGEKKRIWMFIQNS